MTSTQWISTRLQQAGMNPLLKGSRAASWQELHLEGCEADKQLQLRHTEGVGLGSTADRLNQAEAGGLADRPTGLLPQAKKGLEPCCYNT